MSSRGVCFRSGWWCLTRGRPLTMSWWGWSRIAGFLPVTCTWSIWAKPLLSSSGNPRMILQTRTWWAGQACWRPCLFWSWFGLGAGGSCNGAGNLGLVRVAQQEVPPHFRQRQDPHRYLLFAVISWLLYWFVPPFLCLRQQLACTLNLAHCLFF